MSTFEITYEIAPRGLATSFTESEIPPEFAARFRNRYINRAGGAEKRQGITQLGSTVTGTPDLDGVHELVEKDGTETLFVSGNGGIYRYNGSTFSLVHTFATSGKIRSLQFGKFLIFYNGVDRNVYTPDGTTFSELKAIIRTGKANSGSGSNTLKDADVTNWTTGTTVTVNDLVHYPGIGAYALVTLVSAAELSTTAVSAAARGLGASTAAVSAGEPYELIDLVELNIISDGTTEDNVATAGTGTTSTVIAVSGVTFSDTDIKVGDYVSNTTRAAVTDVTSVSANINVTSITGQAAGDSLVFLKSAMPVSKLIHAHYGRLYHIDARDETQIRISGPDDPQDMSTSTGTLDSISFATGTLQGKGDTIVALESFQRFLVVAGKEQVFIYSGTDPIGDGTGSTIDFSPLALMPQGCVAPDGIVNIGDAVMFVSQDGVQVITQQADETQLKREGLTSQINETLRNEIDGTSPDLIQLVHYPQRSWVLAKVGSTIYCINYAVPAGAADTAFGSFSITEFDGKFAQQDAYYVRRNDDLVCAGPGGKVYVFDQNVYADDGQNYRTQYQTGWLTMGGGRRDGGEKPDINQKKTLYIKPLFEAGGSINYSVRAEGGYDAESTDSLTIAVSGQSPAVGVGTIPFTIAGGSVINSKNPLRVNGEVVRLSFETEDGLGPDTLGRYTLYVARGGYR